MPDRADLLALGHAVRKRPHHYFISEDGAGGYLGPFYYLLEEVGWLVDDWNGFSMSVAIAANHAYTANINRPLFWDFWDQMRSVATAESIEEYPMLIFPALVSDWFELSITASGHAHRLRFADGELVAVEETEPTTGEAACTIRFKPDHTLFAQSEGEIPYFKLSGRLRNMAACCPGARFDLQSALHNMTTQFHYPAGIADYLTESLEGWPQFPLLKLEAREGDTWVSIALAWVERRAERPHLLTFVNGKRNVIAGSHIAGLEMGLQRLRDEYLARHKPANMNWTSMFHGLICAISVWTDDEHYADNRSLQFTSETVRDLITTTIVTQLKKLLNDSDGLRNRILSCVARRAH